jgi:hypothetical protein
MDVEKMDLSQLSVLHEATCEFSDNVERVFENAKTLDDVKRGIREGICQDEFLIRETIEKKQGIRRTVIIPQE